VLNFWLFPLVGPREPREKATLEKLHEEHQTVAAEKLLEANQNQLRCANPDKSLRTKVSCAPCYVVLLQFAYSVRLPHYEIFHVYRVFTKKNVCIYKLQQQQKHKQTWSCVLEGESITQLSGHRWEWHGTSCADGCRVVWQNILLVFWTTAKLNENQ